MGMMINRRRVMVGGSNAAKYKLAYHWSGADSLVDNKWIDRVNSCPWTVLDNVIKDGDSYVVGGDQSVGAYFFMDMNYWNLTLGQRWKIEVVFEINIQVRGSVIIDFGSVAGSNHAFSPLAAGLQFADNYKGISNDTIGTYGVLGNSNRPTFQLNTKTKIEYLCEQYSTTEDIQCLVYDGRKYYAPNPHAPTIFDGYNWHQRIGYIGRGFIGTGSGIGKAKIYDIKIYQEEL